MKKNTIYLADDHQIVIDGLRHMISELEQFDILGSTNNGLVAWKQIQLLQPQLVLLDLDMPGMHGMVLAKKIRNNFPEIKIIILSLHSEKSIIKEMMEIPVDGYLLKNSDKDDLQQALLSIANGKQFFAPSITLSLLSPNATKPHVACQSTHDSTLLDALTDREREVLIKICDGLTNREIAEALHISPRTADAHRANLLRKLEAKNVVGLVKFALRVGLSDSNA